MPTVNTAPVLQPVLYVDDEPDNLELFQIQFQGDVEVVTATSAEEAIRILERRPIGLILADERMPGTSGIQFLGQVVERWPDTVRIIVSAYSDSTRLLHAINLGRAYEYVIKPWNRDELGQCIARGLAILARRQELVARADLASTLQEELHAQNDPHPLLVGGQDGLKSVLAAATKAAQSDATVLLRGETGTGKELLARAIHDKSSRAAGPFVRVNCAALSESLLESELFGHEQGAFTGASKTHKGRFETAHGGTIFLDEIGDISPKLQVALLRVLQEHEIERVGSVRTIKVDVRVVAATHRHLEDRIAHGQFREDLFYRLNVLPIELPPLRERTQDIPALVAHFVSKHANRRPPRVASDVIPSLQEYRWPGNVRELENLVQRALVMSDGDVLTLEDFKFQPELPPAVDWREEAHGQEFSRLRQALVSNGGNCSRAARELGIPRTTFIGQAKKLGLL
ncbi:MAG: sigma-54 dependent transcriptional regulator [Polyangiaceae bacterium]